MTKEEIFEEMKQIAEENGLKLTENAEKIASFRARTGLPMNQCPCDKNNPYRGCIGILCKKELEENKICHCQAFQKLD